MAKKYKCRELETKKERRHRKLIKITCFMMVIALICVGMLFHFKSNIYPVVFRLCEAEVKAKSTKALSSAVQSVIAKDYNYDDIVNIEKDNDGKITYIGTNAGQVNKILREVAVGAQGNIDKIEEEFVEVPLGAFTGSVMLAGVGPRVKISLLPVGNVVCEAVTFFEEAGINQTRHSIYIYLTSDISIILPVAKGTVSTTTPFLLCESIIVGEVPDVYLNMSNGKNKPIDLIPK